MDSVSCKKEEAGLASVLGEAQAVVTPHSGRRGAGTVKTESCRISYSTGHKLTLQPSSPDPGEMKAYVHTELETTHVPPTCCVHKRKYSSAIKRNKIWIQPLLMNLTSLCLLREIVQAQRIPTE